ncbi:hypothetical protein [Antrihabitans sp. YC2-6]|uniref:hypothetical protein n=1 Tax=Antrihabitans sp. YC2-6 TaxID=2799498 RepID=UPI0018F6E50F|nr:hypothetical protein [Antrihabitans sp. YC2-6]MBJ8347960.1 hypothetical protein [Antrihabitans sp. YC2-6]
MRIATVAGIALLVSVGGAGLAQAETIDYAVPPNGQWAAGEEKPAVVTPEFSPIQVPAPEVRADEIVAYPYLSPWVHDAVVLPAGRGLEVQGAVQVALPDKPLELNGHCLSVLPRQTQTRSRRSSTSTPDRSPRTSDRLFADGVQSPYA